MGCGASKNVATKDAPAAAPAPAPAAKPSAFKATASVRASTSSLAPAKAASAEPAAAVIVAADVAEAAKPKTPVPADTTPSSSSKKEAEDRSNKSEQPAKKEVLVLTKQLTVNSDSACESADDNSSSKSSISGSSTDLSSLSGTTRGSARLRAAIAAAPDAAETSTDGDQTFEPIGAVIQERPSSRGGMAFDMTFDGEQSRQRAPARLEKLRTRTRSAEMSIEELQQKLAAAETRRQTYEARLKDKLTKENEKVEKVQLQLQATTVQTPSKLKDGLENKESKVLENRQANLRQLRERLQAKEERARKVREAKRLSGNSLDLAAAEPIPAPSVVTAN